MPCLTHGAAWGMIRINGGRGVQWITPVALRRPIWLDVDSEIHPGTSPQLSSLRDQLPLIKRFGAWLMAGYTDRGPYPAGGGFNTLNVAGYHKGYDFDAWMIPAMRMVVDFGRNEPLFLVNSGGQSGNPASAHYDDGIPVWLEGGNRQMSYRPENLKKQYDRVFTLNAPDK